MFRNIEREYWRNYGLKEEKKIDFYVCFQDDAIKYTPYYVGVLNRTFNYNQKGEYYAKNN